jgi:aryl-alcohol dehydrogenase-like predicted oxidoreductase
MVIATKSTAGYRGFMREKEPIQTYFAGNSMKSMHVSIKDGLKKLKNDYIDIHYVQSFSFPLVRVNPKSNTLFQHYHKAWINTFSASSLTTKRRIKGR